MIRLLWRSSILSAVAAASLSAQSPADGFQQAHGGGEALGRAARVVVQGTMETPHGRVPFTLKIRDQAGRLETPEGVWISDGSLTQWWRSGGAGRSPARTLHPGLDAALLMPFRAVARLAGDYQDRGASENAHRFGRTAQRSRFLGAGPERSDVSLEFDPATGLLAACRIESLDESFDPLAILYEDYRRVEGVAVPFRVRRLWDGRLNLALHVESVAFQASLSPNEFEIQDAGGRP